MSEYTTHPSAIKRLERPENGRILAGVAAGLGNYFELSPAFFRLGFVVLTLLGGSGVLLYLAALLIIPDAGKEHSIAAEALEGRRDRPGRVVAIGLVGIALAVLISRAAFWWPAAGAGWVVILVAGLAILWMYDARRGDRRSMRLVKALFAVVVLALVAVLAAGAIAFAWFDISPSAGTGNRYITPTSLTTLHRSYHLGIGDMRLDLSQLPAITTPTTVNARVDVGALYVTVPANASVAVDAHAKVGQVRVFQQTGDGRDVVVTSGNGLLVIHARVGAGHIDVSRRQG